MEVKTAELVKGNSFRDKNDDSVWLVADTEWYSWRQDFGYGEADTHYLIVVWRVYADGLSWDHSITYDEGAILTVESWSKIV